MLTSLSLSLLLTLAIELGFALLWGLRRRDLLLCALVNILTNPVVVLMYLLIRRPCAVAVWEGLAVAIEGWHYRRYGRQIRRPCLFSLLCNVLSFFLGLVINQLMDYHD